MCKKYKKTRENSHLKGKTLFFQKNEKNAKKMKKKLAIIRYL